jgi:hypothetical protein
METARVAGVQSVRRSGAEGAWFGLVAGVLSAMAAALMATFAGYPPPLPLQLFASLLLGRAALDPATAGAAVMVGLLIHLGLSALFGLGYGLLNVRLPSALRRRWRYQAAVGLLYGLGLWVVNIQIVARLLYPWFLALPAIGPASLHLLCFGLPVGLCYASAEQRGPRLVVVPGRRERFSGPTAAS